jgi:translocation and assembly module TamB
MYIAGPPPAPPTPVQRKAWRWLLAAALLTLACLGAAAYWLTTPQAAHWALRQAQVLSAGALQVDGAQGDPRNVFSAAKVSIRTATVEIAIQNLRWTVADLGWLTRRIHLAQLTAESVEVRFKPSTTPATAPQTLALPYQMALLIDDLQIQKVSFPGKNVAPVETVAAKIGLTPSQHSIEIRTLVWDGLQASGTAQFETSGALNTQLSIAAQRPAQEKLPALQLAVVAQGPLAQLPTGAALRANNQQLDLSASIQPWAANPLPMLDARFTSLNLKAITSTLPQTALEGTAKIFFNPNATSQVQIDARNTRPATWDTGGLPVTAFAARLSGAGDEWAVQTLDLQLRAGRITGSGRISNKPWSADLQAQEVRLDLLDTRLPAAVVSGKTSAKADSLQSPVRFDADLQMQPMHANGRAGTASLAARGATDLRTSILLERFELQSGGTRASGQANARKESATSEVWLIEARAALENITPDALQPFRKRTRTGNPAAKGKLAALNYRLNATADLRARTNFANAAPLLSAQLTTEIRDSVLQGQTLQGQGSLTLSPNTQTIAQNGILKIPPALRALRISSAATLQWGSVQTTWQGALGQIGDRLDWQLDAPELRQFQTLSAWLPLPSALQGALTARGALAGGWQQAVVNLSATARAMRVGDLQLANAEVKVNAGAAPNAPLELAVEANRLSGALPAKTTVEKLALNASGTWADHRIRVNIDANQDKHNLRANSELTGALSVDPEAAVWQWRGKLLRTQVLPQIASAALSNTNTLLNVESVALQIQGISSRLAVDVEQGSAQILAVPVQWQRIRFDTGTASGQGRLIDAQGTVGPLDVATLKKLTQGTTPLLDQWDGDLTLAGRFSLQATEQLRADIRIERTGGDLRLRDVAAGEPLGLTNLVANLNVNNGVWQFDHALAGHNIGALQLSLSARSAVTALFPESKAPLTGQLSGRVDNIAPWSIFMPMGWRVGGRIAGGAQFSGTLGQPVAQGRFIAEQVSVRNLIEGIDIHSGYGEAVFSEREIALQNIRARAGDGTVTASGSVTLGQRQTLQLQAQADQFGALNRVDRQITVSGNASARVEQNRLQIQGNLRVDRGLIDLARQDAPTLSDDVTVQRASSTHDAASNAAARTTTLLDLTVNAGNALRLRGRGIDTLLRGELKFTTPGGRLAAQGQLRTELGTYAAYRQRLEIERGILSYPTATGGNVGNPQLEVIALRPNIEPRVGVSITGTALAPRVRLFSEPEMPDSEKLAWLVLGRGFEGASRDDTKLVQEAALALLAGEKGGVTQQLTQAIGLDTLSIGSRAGVDNVNETVVSLGKQISRRVYVGYERGLNSTTGAWQLIYRLTNRFTLRAQSGTDPSIDMIWTWRFD